mgnify:CR=1 FL=1
MVDTAVVFLVRGADANWRSGVERFAASLATTPAGCSYKFYVVAKGFASGMEKAAAIGRLMHFEPTVVEVSDDAFDIGAYRDAMASIGEELVCFMNTHAEILAPGWLRKLVIAIRRPGMGMVGATGSFESLSQIDVHFPAFPNVHIRTNAFMIRRLDTAGMLASLSIRDKLDAFMVESGPRSLTRRLVERGLDVAVVARSGRPYSPPLWPWSGTYRQQDQHSLLIGDNQTRAYRDAPWASKRDLVRRTWGHHLQLGNRLSWG